MLKKAICGAVAVLGLLALSFGSELTSYLTTGVKSVQQAVRAEVPIEFELQRARQLVEELLPDVRRCMHVVAEQQVEVEHLTASIQRKTSELAQQKQAIMTLRTALATGNTLFQYAGRSYRADEVQRDLSCRFTRYQGADEVLAADRKILTAREQTLAANQDRLAGLMAAKQDLQVRLEQLEARLQTLRAAETVSHLAIDDSQLSRAKRLIDELNRQLDVKQKVLDAEGQLTGLIPVEQTDASVPVDLGQQIDAYFSPSEADPASGDDAGPEKLASKE